MSGEKSPPAPMGGESGRVGFFSITQGLNMSFVKYESIHVIPDNFLYFAKPIFRRHHLINLSIYNFDETLV